MELYGIGGLFTAGYMLAEMDKNIKLRTIVFAIFLWPLFWGRILRKYLNK